MANRLSGVSRLCREVTRVEGHRCCQIEACEVRSHRGFDARRQCTDVVPAVLRARSWAFGDRKREHGIIQGRADFGGRCEALRSFAIREAARCVLVLPRAKVRKVERALEDLCQGDVSHPTVGRNRRVAVQNSALRVPACPRDGT
eukprot:2510095-Pleurochrysis_carterae.AAC.1